MRQLLAAVLAVGLTGCATEPGRQFQQSLRELQEFFTPSKGRQTLSAGLKQYEEGQYDESLKNLQSAIQQGLGERDRVTAHKHVAFIHCASNRVAQCRDEFKKALAVDPSMDLAPEEADHPVWGRVFRSVKAGR